MKAYSERYQIDTTKLPRWYDVWGYVDDEMFVIEEVHAEDDDGNVISINPDSMEWADLEAWLDVNWPRIVYDEDPAEYWRKEAAFRRKHDLR